MTVAQKSLPITPVFVLGGARNGTTWLGNVLGLHPEITTVQHELHHGSHESNIFRQQRFYGDLSDPDAYIRFVQLYATEDYFQLAGGTPERLYKHRFATFYEAFFDLMDRYTLEQGNTHWSTKLDPLFAVDDAAFTTFLSILRARYKTVKWVGIQRDVVACMNSYVWMEGRQRASRSRAINRVPTLLLGGARYAAQYDFLRKFGAKVNAFWMEFDELKKDREATSARLDVYLGLENSLGIGVPDQYRKNTSFKGRVANQELSGTERRFVRTLNGVFSKLPGLATGLYGLYENRIKGITDPTYRKLLKRRYFPEQFATELDQVGATDLLDQLGTNKAGSQ